MRRLLIVSAVCLSLLGFAPPEAHAAPDNNLCDKGEFCVWESPNMTGCFSDFGEFSGPEDMQYAHYETCPSIVMNDSISSFRNNSTMVALFSTEPARRGKNYCMYANSSSTRIHSDWNDTVSYLLTGEYNGSFGKDANCSVHKRGNN